MSQDQANKMHTDKGFIAALDQSGGSTPTALAAYGVTEGSYSGEEEMFDMVHAMRTRIMVSPKFTGDRILGAILFKETMERQVEGKDTADYLWEEKGIVPFLKIDSGLAEEVDGVQMMKPMPGLDELLARANEKHIFGTKMRSVIKSHNPQGMQAVVDQQFEVAKKILAAGLVPIIEPEVDIHSSDKSAIEDALAPMLQAGLDSLDEGQRVIFKLTLPDADNLYQGLTASPRVLRVVALSGGYSRDEANARLSRNTDVVASFSRALANGLSVDQSDEEFDVHLDASIQSIFDASVAG